MVVVRTGSPAPNLEKLKMSREQRKFKISMRILFFLGGGALQDNGYGHKSTKITFLCVL